MRIILNGLCVTGNEGLYLEGVCAVTVLINRKHSRTAITANMQTTEGNI